MQVVQLGVNVHPLELGHMNISLFYTDIAKFASSQVIAVFKVPYTVNKYVRFALQVTGETVTMFYNCRKFETISVKRHTEELLFDPASTLYIGQAGPIIKGNLDVSRLSFHLHSLERYTGC